MAIETQEQIKRKNLRDAKEILLTDLMALDEHMSKRSKDTAGPIYKILRARVSASKRLLMECQNELMPKGEPLPCRKN